MALMRWERRPKILRRSTRSPGPTKISSHSGPSRKQRLLRNGDILHRRLLPLMSHNGEGSTRLSTRTSIRVTAPLWKTSLIFVLLLKKMVASPQVIPLALMMVRRLCFWLTRKQRRSTGSLRVPVSLGLPLPVFHRVLWVLVRRPQPERF